MPERERLRHDGDEPPTTRTLARARRRVRLGRLFADEFTFDEAVAAIVELARHERGGFVVTPNVDHVVLAEDDAALRAAYDEAALALVDGMPLVWLSRALGHPLPEKISGSDLAEPLLASAAHEGLRVFFLGAREGIAARAAERARARHPSLQIVGVESPPLGFEKDPDALHLVLDKVRASSPHLVLVALGCPKQELFMAAHHEALRPAVLLGVGATLDFLAGTVQRAPAWMSRVGLEWLYRLAQEPRRMASRYLVRDRAIVSITLAMLRQPWERRAYTVEPEAGGAGSTAQS